MALGSLLLFLALLVLVALFVVQPLLRARDETELPDAALSHWTAERERALDALAELDADHAMGKVPADLFADQRADLLAAGALALEQIEKLAKPVRRSRKSVRADDLEDLIAAHKAKRKRAARSAR
ncbi:MAG: hypothetical protein KIS80_10645 [Anaerolineales bacterium]|nr:hypothetical protein [Anaerolineales bacterium]